MFTFGTLVHLRNIQVKLVYQGYQVKVKVTLAKKRVCIYPVRRWFAAVD